MPGALADKLLSAQSERDFVRSIRRADWNLLARLKDEVDELISTDLKKATRLVERIRKVAAIVGGDIAGAYAWICKARIHYVRGEHVKANDLYDAGVATLISAGLKPQAGMIQIQQLDALKFLGRYDEAIKTAKSAKRNLGNSGSLALAKLETNLGNVYFHLDKYRTALDHYDRARAMLSKSSNRTARGLIDFCRSCVYIETDQPGRAVRILESVTRAYEAAGKTLTSAQIKCQSAYLQFLRGDYNSALAAYYEAGDKLTEFGGEQDVAFYNLELAEVLLSLNSYDEASENASRAEGLFRKLGMVYELGKAMQLNALAQIGLGRLDAARQRLTRSRRIFEKSGNETFVALTDSYLAEIALRRGRAVEGRTLARESLKVFARQKLAARSSLSRLQMATASYTSGDLKNALRLVGEASDGLSGIFAPGLAYRCHHLTGRIHAQRGQEEMALESFRRSVEIVEQLRGGIAADEFKGAFLTDKLDVYEDSVRLCLDAAEKSGKTGLMEEAFRLVELSKSRALADLVARYLRGAEKESAKSPKTKLEETRARLLQSIEELNWYSSNLGLEDDKGEQRSANVAGRYQQAVVKSERRIAGLFRRLQTEDGSNLDADGARPVNSNGLRQILAEDEAVIEYFVAGDEICCFIATRDRLKVVRGIASRRRMEKLLAAVRFQIEKFNYGSVYVEAHFTQLMKAAAAHLKEIYEAIFLPVEHEISCSKLIIIPHGTLHYIPFHALQDGRNYLIDRFEISYAPSASVLMLCRQRGNKSAGSKMVALGVNEEGLPGISDELSALGSVFPDGVRLHGEDATLANLLQHASGARFLHLASHGSFRRDNPMFSFLKLADTQLNFYSLLDLKLDAELVTLSACRTGVNAVFPGDELHGLTRGFLYAGAPALVMSLWAVSDRSTAEFMSCMYSALKAGAGKRSALRQAQLAIKDSYGHPYYWAPFVLIGNPV